MSEPLKYVQTTGPCPFLLCLIQVPHEHPICPECDAVRFGNMYCETCRREGPIERAIEVALARAGDRRSS